MTIKNNIRLLDTDEDVREESEANIPQDIKDFAKKYGLIIDLATSDVVGYLEDRHGGSVCFG